MLMLFVYFIVGLVSTLLSLIIGVAIASHHTYSKITNDRIYVWDDIVYHVEIVGIDPQALEERR